jgi:hypothetical protein
VLKRKFCAQNRRNHNTTATKQEKELINPGTGKLVMLNHSEKTEQISELVADCSLVDLPKGRGGHDVLHTWGIKQIYWYCCCW